MGLWGKVGGEGRAGHGTSCQSQAIWRGPCPSPRPRLVPFGSPKCPFGPSLLYPHGHKTCLPRIGGASEERHAPGFHLRTGVVQEMEEQRPLGPNPGSASRQTVGTLCDLGQVTTFLWASNFPLTFKKENGQSDNGLSISCRRGRDLRREFTQWNGF